MPSVILRRESVSTHRILSPIAWLKLLHVDTIPLYKAGNVFLRFRILILAFGIHRLVVEIVPELGGMDNYKTSFISSVWG